MNDNQKFRDEVAKLVIPLLVIVIAIVVYLCAGAIHV